MRTIMWMMVAATAATSALSAQAQRGGQEQLNAFTWSGELAAGARLTVRNLNGAIRVEAATGRTLEITAHKRWRRGDPKLVSVDASRLNSGRDVLICAKLDPSTECTEGGYRSRSSNGTRNNDTSVEILVKLPAGAHLTVATVNGALEIRGASGEVRATTVNGGIEAESSGGAVMAETVNGSIRVREAVLPTRGASYKTVNGTITVAIPEGSNLELEARTVNGSITTDFPISVQGSISPRRLRGTIGTGGPRLELTTVNGSIRLTKY
jgi:hypothetical protein